MRGGGIVGSEEKAYISQFETEGEEQVRRNMGRGVYGARGYSVAVDWLERRSAAREKQTQEARHLSERQARAAEVANQFSERQAQMAESANRLAKDANRLSKWAIGLSILGCILAAVAILYDHA
jgi:hypothetical protein